MKIFIAVGLLLGLMSFTVSAREIQSTTKIKTLLDGTTYPNFKTHSFKNGFRIKTELQQPETKIAELPVLAEGKKCELFGVDDSDAQTYEADDSYFLDTISEHAMGGDAVPGSYYIRLKGFHSPATLTIRCINSKNLTFQDIANDLGVIEFLGN